MFPEAPNYRTCFSSTGLSDTGGYSQYGTSGVTYVHLEDAAKVCWLGGSSCGSVLFYTGVYFLRTTAGSAAAVSGAVLYTRESVCSP